MRYYDAILQALGTEIVTEDEFTGAEILTRLLGVDGTASGLDADLLDGNQAAAFALTNDTRLSDARTPVAHDHSGNKLAQANTHESADTDSATTALHHTIGTGANQACAGNDTRLSDARTPTAHDHSGVYQPADADLTAIAELSGTGGYAKRTADDTWTIATPSAADVGAAASDHAHTGVYQPVDADLTAIAALSGTGGYAKRTAEDTWEISNPLGNFVATLNTVSPNDTVNVAALSVTGGTTNVDVAITPKGTGAFMLQVPTGTTVGGNKRGQNSVDFGVSRSAADQVASGDYSVNIAGYRGKASGAYSVNIMANGIASDWYAINMGYSGTASSWYAINIGYNGTASDWYTINMGAFGIASNDYAINLGASGRASGLYSINLGSSGTASGSYSINLGWSGTASGSYSINLGWAGTASGSYSINLGRAGTASGSYSINLGLSGTTSRDYAINLGRSGTASGEYAINMGQYGIANSYCLATFGRYNIGGGNVSSWVDTDPLFEIGIGADASNRANALRILKNGNFGILTSLAEAGVTYSQLNVNGGQLFVGASSTQERPRASITPGIVDITDASRKYKLDLSAWDTSERIGLTIEASGTAPKLGFFGATAVVKATALTTDLTPITYTEPGTPDYAIQNLVQNTGFGFATADEGNTILKIILNLQTRVKELEDKLKAYGLLT